MAAYPLFQFLNALACLHDFHFVYLQDLLEKHKLESAKKLAVELDSLYQTLEKEKQVGYVFYYYFFLQFLNI